MDDPGGNKRLIVLMGDENQQLFRLPRRRGLDAEHFQLAQRRPGAAGRGVKNHADITGGGGGQRIRLGFPGEIAG